MTHRDPESPLPKQPAQSDTPAPLARIVVGELDHPLVEMVPYQPDATQQGNSVALDVEQRSSLSALLSQAPALVQSVQGAFTQTYHLTFAPDVAQHMAGVMKGAEGGLRAIAVDAQGKIVGHGVLDPVNGVRALSAATAIWQGLALVTAQVHLTEINARLAQLEQRIDTIKALLEAEQMSKLVTGLHYVREASTAVAQGNVGEQERHLIAAQIERIWLESGQVVYTCLQLLEQTPQAFAQLPLSAWYQLEASAALAHQAIAAYEQRASAYLTAVYVRSATVAVREQLGLSRSISESHGEELQGHTADWRDNRDAFFRVVHRNVQRDLSATLSRQATVDTERRKINAFARATKERLNQQCNIVDQAISHIHVQLQQPLCLVVTLDEDGQITEAYEMPVASMP